MPVLTVTKVHRAATAFALPVTASSSVAAASLSASTSSSRDLVSKLVEKENKNTLIINSFYDVELTEYLAGPYPPPPPP